MNLRDNYPNTGGMAGLQASSGFTRQQRAQQLKISRSLVVLVENKKRCMPAHMLVKIASLKIQPAENKMQQQPLLPHPAELEFSTPDIQPASLYEPEPKSRLQNLKLPTVTFRIKMIAMLFYIFQLPYHFFSFLP